MEKKLLKLLLVDEQSGIAGVEDLKNYVLGVWQFVDTTTDLAGQCEFREVTEDLASCAAGRPSHVVFGSAKKTRCEGGWNPQRFHGGDMTGALIGPLSIVNAIFRKRVTIFMGGVVDIDGVEYAVRPCKADLMPVRLYERWRTVHLKERERRLAPSFGLFEARRICFGARNNPVPKQVFFAKGTTSVEPPRNAVARIGGSESSTIVFLDKICLPISAYKSAGSWDCWYVKAIPIPERLDWHKFSPLGRSDTDLLFGVHG